MKKNSKRILSCLMALALLIPCCLSGLVLPVSATSTVALIEDFEDSNTAAAIAGWVGMGKLVADPTNADNTVLKVTTAMTNTWSGGCFGLQGNRLYALSVSYYGGTATVEFNVGSSKGITAPGSNPTVTATTAWKTVTYYFKTWESPKNDGYSIKMTATADTLIDNVLLVDLGAAPTENLLIGGDFDSDLSYAYNGYWSGAVASGASVVTDPADSSNKALYLPSTFPQQAATYYGAVTHAWEANTTYTLSARVYGGPVSFYLNSGKGVAAEGGGWVDFVPSNTTSWQTFTHTFTTGSSVTDDVYGFGIGLQRSLSTTGTYVDDIVIAKKAAEPAESIALSPATLTLAVGSFETLTVVATPTDGTVGTLTWTSTNESAVTVANGVVTAVGAGAAVIKATDGDKLTATCTVTVPETATGFTLSPKALHLASGASKTLAVTATPAGADVGTLTWTSNNTGAVTVVNGKVTAVGDGTATITVSNGTLSDTMTVTVDAYGELLTGGNFESGDWQVPLWTTNFINAEAGSVVTDPDDPTNAVACLKPSTNAVYLYQVPVQGNTAYVLTYKVKGGTVRTSISSTHAAVGGGWENTTPAAEGWTTVTKIFTTAASPNKNYLLAIGNTTDMATYIDDVSLKALPAATAITLSTKAATLSHHATLELAFTTTPAQSNVGTLTWTSSKPAVATVDQNGKVTALTSGETTITVSNGTLSDTCTITVPQIAETFMLKDTTLHLAVGTYKTVSVLTEGGLSAGTLTWSTNAADVVSVDESGKVTALAEGTATVTVTNYNGVSATVTVAVNALGERISGGNFENGDWNNQTLTTNIIGDGSGSVVAETDGNHVLQIPATVTSTLYFAPAPIEGGKTYVVTMKAKGASIRTHVIATHCAAGDLGETNTALQTDAWTTVSFVFTTKESPNKNYAIAISNHSDATLSIDDISWKELPAADSLAVTPTTVKLLPNGSTTLKVSAVPALSNMGTVTWSSSDPNLISVDQDGNVTAIASSGTVTITATNDKGKTGTATVTIDEYANLLTNGDFELGNTLYYSDGLDLNASILPGIGKDGSYGLRLHNTGDGSRASVYYRKALALQPGTTYVFTFDYVMTENAPIRLWSGTMGFDNIYTEDKQDKRGTWCTVTQVFTTPADMALNTNWDLAIVVDGEGSDAAVIDNLCLKLYDSGVEAESITLSKTAMTLIPGRTGALSVYASPLNGDTNRMTWTSSNDNVATVEYGVVTGVGKGTATITGTTKNGKSATCVVTVSGNDTFLLNGTFDAEQPNTSWTLAGGAMISAKTGVSETASARLTAGASISQRLTGKLKANTTYQLILRYRTPDRTAANVSLSDGINALVEETTGTSAYWSKTTYEFTTGDTVGDELTFSVALAGTDGTVYVDNVILAQKASLVDLVVTDIIWDGGDGQVKPGTALSFAATVYNQGEDKVKNNQSFDVNICLDGQVIQTLTYTGELAAGDMTIVTGEAAWKATGVGDHVVSAHVNPTLSVLEIDDTNNTYQVNLRIAEERLVAPEAAQEAGMTDLIFSDDFDTINSIDRYATGDAGYKWYVTRRWGNGTAQPDEYSVANGILTLHQSSSANNITLSTMDVDTGNGFSWNTGYLEVRFRIPDADGRQVNNAGNIPAIWSFPVNKHLETEGENNHYVEMDWMEYWGLNTDKWPQYPDGYYTVTLHDQTFDNGDMQTWFSNTGVGGRFQNGLGDEQWHVMGWRWEKGKLCAYLDGVKVMEQHWSSGEEPTPDASDQLDGTASTEDIFTLIDEQFNVLYLCGHKDNPMEVDYVRIWQGDGSVVSPDDDDDTTAIDVAAEDFWYDFCTDDWADPIVAVTEDNYQSILSGEAVWNALSEERRSEINALLASFGQPSFDRLLADAKLLANGGTPGTPDTGERTRAIVPLTVSLMMVSAAVLWTTVKRRKASC